MSQELLKYKSYKKDADITTLIGDFFNQTKHNQDLSQSHYCYGMAVLKGLGDILISA